MSHEADFYARMVADTTPVVGLVAILTGGIYQASALSPLGITRETTAAAFDANGYLKPCALVRQGAIIPTGDVVDYDAQMESVRQTVQVWLYSDEASGYTAIDAAIARLRLLFFGIPLADTFEPRVSRVRDRERDPAALKNASMAIMDFQLDFVLEIGG